MIFGKEIREESVPSELSWWYNQNKNSKVVIKFKQRSLIYYMVKDRKDDFYSLIYYPADRMIGIVGGVKKEDFDFIKRDSVNILFKDKKLYEELYGSFVLEGI